MKHSKISQRELDVLTPNVIFQEKSEQEKQADKEQRELERTGSYMQALRTEPKDPITASQAEAICEQMLIVREQDAQIPF